MSEMVERVARAICLERFKGRGSDEDPAHIDSQWRHYLGFARAAIEAMREPTEAMKHAGAYSYPNDSESAYRAMIDAALAS